MVNAINPKSDILESGKQESEKQESGKQESERQESERQESERLCKLRNTLKGRELRGG